MWVAVVAVDISQFNLGCPGESKPQSITDYGGDDDNDGDGNDDGDDVQLGLSRRKVKSIHFNTDYNHKWRSGFCLK